MTKVIDNLVDATAVAYLLTYTCLMERDRELRSYYSDKASIYLFPAIINAAFSCEVAIKNLIKVHQGKFVRGHDLKNLFNQLPQRLQEKYREQTVAFYNEIALRGNGHLLQTDFSTCLDKIKDTYEHKRYLYENPFSLDVDFLESLMFSLNDAREEYIDFKKSVMG